jgi:hypothetical protein
MTSNMDAVISNEVRDLSLTEPAAVGNSEISELSNFFSFV